MIVTSLALAATLSLGRAESFSILAGSGVRASGPMRVTGNVGAGSGGVTGVVPVVGEILPGKDALKDVEKALDDIGSASDIVVYRLSDNPTFANPPPSVPSSRIFWLVTGSATLPARSSFVGTLIATSDIDVREGVTVSGRLISLHGSVTLTTDDINLCCDPIELSPLPNGIVSARYDAKILPDGDTFSLFAGTLPLGLGPLAPDGTLSGVPTKPGSYTFIVLAQNFKGCTSIRTYTIDVACPTITVSPTTLSRGTVFIPYSKVITITGGSPPYTLTPTVIGPLTLPPQTAANGTATLSGFPIAASILDFTVIATDVNGCSGSQTYHIAINAPLAPGPVIPTLSEWMLAMLAVVLAGAGFSLLRRAGP